MAAPGTTGSRLGVGTNFFCYRLLFRWGFGTNFHQSQPLVRNFHFGLSPVNYSNSQKSVNITVHKLFKELTISKSSKLYEKLPVRKWKLCQGDRLKLLVKLLYEQFIHHTRINYAQTLFFLVLSCVLISHFSYFLVYSVCIHVAYWANFRQKC